MTTVLTGLTMLVVGLWIAWVGLWPPLRRRMVAKGLMKALAEPPASQPDWAALRKVAHDRALNTTVGGRAIAVSPRTAHMFEPYRQVRLHLQMQVLPRVLPFLCEAPKDQHLEIVFDQAVQNRHGVTMLDSLETVRISLCGVCHEMRVSELLSPIVRILAGLGAGTVVRQVEPPDGHPYRSSAEVSAHWLFPPLAGTPMMLSFSDAHVGDGGIQVSPLASVKVIYGERQIEMSMHQMMVALVSSADREQST